MRPGPLCMLLHCLLLPSGEPSACEAKEGGQEERSFPKTGWSFLINYIFHIAFYMAEERLMTFFVLNLTSCWNVMLHISTQTARWRLTPTSPLNVHQSQRETWLLPFKFKFFRKSITLSIIHKSTYKEVAKPNKENLCILLTCILQLIQDFISRGVKKKKQTQTETGMLSQMTQGLTKIQLLIYVQQCYECYEEMLINKRSEKVIFHWRAMGDGQISAC